MRTTPERTSHRSAVLRHFEPSRLDSANLAVAFEHALPTIRRTTGPDRSPSLAVDQRRRTRSVVS
jgi:hypothetical protein